MLGVDEFVFRTVSGEFLIRVLPARSQLTREQSRLADRIAFALLFGIESNDLAAVELARRLEHALFLPRSESFNALDEWFGGGPFAEGHQSHLKDQFVSGRLVVEARRNPSLGERREEPAEPVDDPAPPRETSDTFFEVRLVDEIGQSVSGVPVEFSFDRERHEVRTNAGGVALLEHVVAAGASAFLQDPAGIQKVLDARWQRLRPGVHAREGNTTEIVFEGDVVGPVAVKAAVPNTIVLKPPLGRLFVELWDKAGRARHAGRKYSIDGPTRLTGVTDALGQLRHEEVFPGDYTLHLTLDFSVGSEEHVNSYQSPLVMLDPSGMEPQMRRLGAVPFCVLARLHLFFNTNKAFLLPAALPELGELRRLYLENNPSRLLVVGHADTAGGPDFNDRLSLERAEATIAYLKDDVDAWLAFYGMDIPPKKRWGSAEDRMMLIAMLDFTSKPKGEDATRWFQRTRELQVDGIAGPETRRQLITEYMTLDGASLEEFGIRIDATAHGCGENFPLDASGEELDSAPANQKRDPGDRRVELFFFDSEFGIVPRPPGDNSGPGSSEYTTWRERAIQTHDLRAGSLGGPKLTFVELADVHFRNNSAVVLPEGRAPGKGPAGPESLTSAGVFATVLRFNAEHPGRRSFVAGHADTTGGVPFNQKLSEERARCSLALLLGGDEQREIFEALCNERHTVSDYKQILAWIAREFTELAFDCDPGSIDDNAATGVEPVRRFQRAYNRNKAALGATGSDLVADGQVGPLTWGAIFDCYEFALKKELGEVAESLAALREQLVFVDADRKALGFSEHFPIEELGVDNLRSEANRRVEILFFEDGEEPDLRHAAEDPETTELYLPGHYRRTSVSGASSSGSVLKLRLRVLDGERNPLANALVRVEQANLRFDAVADAAGFVEISARREPSLLRIEWAKPDHPPSGEFTFSQEFFPAPGIGERGAFERLHNLGYSADSTLRGRVLAFQEDFGRPETGNFVDIEQEVIAWHDGGKKPPITV